MFFLSGLTWFNWFKCSSVQNILQYLTIRNSSLSFMCIHYSRIIEQVLNNMVLDFFIKNLCRIVHTLREQCTSADSRVNTRQVYIHLKKKKVLLHRALHFCIHLEVVSWTLYVKWEYTLTGCRFAKGHRSQSSKAVSSSGQEEHEGNLYLTLRLGFTTRWSIEKE